MLLYYRPRLPSPAWANQSKFPTRFTNSMNQQDQSSVLSNSGNYDNGGNLINKQAHVQAPKRTRSPVQYDDLDGFTEDTVSVQTESKRYCAHFVSFALVLRIGYCFL